MNDIPEFIRRRKEAEEEAERIVREEAPTPRIKIKNLREAIIVAYNLAILPLKILMILSTLVVIAVIIKILLYVVGYL